MAVLAFTRVCDRKNAFSNVPPVSEIVEIGKALPLDDSAKQPDDFRDNREFLGFGLLSNSSHAERFRIVDN